MIMMIASDIFTNFIISILICSILDINAAIIALYITAKMTNDNVYYNRIIGFSIMSFSTVFYVSFLIVFPIVYGQLS